MPITVKFFASLRENLQCSDAVINIDDLATSPTAVDAWHFITKQELPANVLCAINHEHCETKQAINDGDELAFFPPITGG